MFEALSEIPSQREGTLAQTPLPLLLQSIAHGSRSVMLELHRSNIEKKIYFEDGVPVQCASNLLHERIEKFLVEKEKLTAEQAQHILQESVLSGDAVPDVLVRENLIPAFDLFRFMQQNLAFKILDCFTWGDARWKVVENGYEEPTPPLKMKAEQLILTGVCNFAPFEVVAGGLVFFDQQRFGISPAPRVDLKHMRFSAKDQRALEALKARPTFTELCQAAQLQSEDGLRRLYALMLLGIAAPAEELPAVAAPAAPAAPPPGMMLVPTAADLDLDAAALGAVAEAMESATASLADVTRAAQQLGKDEIEKRKNALTDLYMRHRTMDAFALLGVGENPPTGELKKSYMAFAERFAPWHYKGEDLGGLADKAEELFMAGARAFATILNPELRTQEVMRKRNTEKSKTENRQKRAEEHFKINTNLLDADSQFQEGLTRFKQSNIKAAIEYFQQAADIEPRRGPFVAYLWYARYLSMPETSWQKAVEELAAAEKIDPRCDLLPFNAGEILRARGEYARAEEAYKRAFKVNPENRKAADLAREVARMVKRR